MLSFSLAGVCPFAFPSSLSSTDVAACWYRFSRVLVPWFLFYLLILDSSHVSFTDLQRLAGKCMSMFMAVPGARLFAKEINMAISSASRSSRPLPLTVPLRHEIEHWLFSKSWSGFLPWRLERLHQFVLFTDASSYRWAGVLNPNAVPLYASDYWSGEILSAYIVVKGALALSNASSSFFQTIKDSRVDVYVDSST